MPPATADPPLRFGRFEIQPAERVLRIDGQVAPLGARAFDVLLALAERRGRLVSKQELLDLVWPGLVVEEHNIATQISSLRKLLPVPAIATVPGRGYRFVAAPDELTPEATAPGRAPHRHNLPEQRTRFIGRSAALADLERLLPSSRLLTLTGIGGCGKTRLALQFAGQRLADFADGVWFVDLAPLNDAGRVAATCAAALGLDPGSDTPGDERIAHHLEGRTALIVLDNCEHVRAGAAALADAVLARPGRTRILATSREPLGVTGEQACPVRPLSLPATADLDAVRAADAVRVFVDRVRLAVPDFDVAAGNASAIVEICRRLDGIALAIELAAARVPMLSVFEIAGRLEHRFRLLTGSARVSARQQTLLAVMQWSDDLLAPEEQRMLRRLSVFAGGCGLAGAMAAADIGDEYEALRLLGGLHDKSLLLVEPGRAAEPGRPPRYRLLETVREYAHQRLVACGEAGDAHARHAAHCLDLAEQAAPHLRGPLQSTWMARLREEQENLVAALDWHAGEGAEADPHAGLRLVAATGRYWLFHEVELGCRLVERALQRDRSGADSRPRLEALLGLAAMYLHRGRGDEGVQRSQTALAMAERMGSVEAQARAHVGIGGCLPRQAAQRALRHYEQARDLARAGGHAGPLSSALNNIANIDFEAGRLESARDGLRQALHLSRGGGDVRGALIVLHNLVRVLVSERRHEEARTCAIESEQLLRSVEEDVLKLELIEVSAGLASSRGEHAVAARFFGVAIQRFVEAGYRRPPMDQGLLEQLSDQSRHALGEEAFEAARQAGRALDLEAAMQELGRWLSLRPS